MLTTFLNNLLLKNQQHYFYIYEVTFGIIRQIIRYTRKLKKISNHFWGYSSFNFEYLNISFCKFSWRKVTELSFFSSCWKDLSKFLYFTLRSLSWSLSMRTFSFRLWHIHTSRQKQNWQITKEFIISLLCLIDDARLDKTLTFSLPVTRCAVHNTDLPSNSSVSKTVRVNIASRRNFFKEFSLSFLMLSKFKDFALVVGITAILFFNFSGTERVNLLTCSFKFFAFTTGRCFTSDCDFSGVITR